MVEKIVKQIKSLPPLPESVLKVKEISDNPEGTIKELVEIVKQDPPFTADILKAANSPLYGFSRQITSIDQAISLFGMGTIQGFAISYAVRQTIPLDLSSYGISPHEFTRVSMLQNALAFRWGRPQINTFQSEFMTLSLLMELGKVVAGIVLREEGKSEDFKKAVESVETLEEIESIEKEFMGINSEWIAALIFKHWQFNETIIEIMKNIANPDKAPENLRKQTQILYVVKEILPVTRPFCETCRQSAYDAADRFGLDAGGISNAVKEVQDELG